MKRFPQRSSFFAIFCWRQNFFKKKFTIKWHGWLVYLLRKSYAKFQTCSFKGKKVMIVLLIPVLSSGNFICKVLVCIFNGFRKGIGGKHWFSEREHIKLWYFENLKDFWCIKYLCSVVVWKVFSKNRIFY